VHVAVYCPLLVSLLLGAAAPALARRLPPATAARLLTACSVAAALATTSALALLALPLVGQLPPVAAVGHWSPGRLAALSPVPWAVAAAAVAALVGCAANGVRIGVARLRAVREVVALGRDLGPSGGRLVVVDDDVDAVAVPAAGGRIVVSRGLLAELRADERRALLLHEDAHLHHRHHLYRLVVDLAGAVDPLQHRARRAVVLATERWADEEAAAGVGDRTAVARLLARSALSAGAPARRPAWPALAMGRAGSPVVPRVRALLAPAPRQRPALLAATAAVAVFAAGCVLHAQADADTSLDQAAAAQAAHAAVDAGVPGPHHPGVPHRALTCPPVPPASAPSCAASRPDGAAR
jgi:Zn-dependent protease with chaperone function